MDMMWHGNSRNLHIHFSLSGIHCECDVGTFSKQCVQPIHGSRCFAFVVGALLFLHLVFWFLNHVAMQCSRESPKRVG